MSLNVDIQNNNIKNNNTFSQKTNSENNYQQMIWKLPLNRVLENKSNIKKYWNRQQSVVRWPQVGKFVSAPCSNDRKMTWLSQQFTITMARYGIVGFNVPLDTL